MAAIRDLTKDADPKVRHLATLDLNLLHFQHGYQDTLASIETETSTNLARRASPTAGAPAGPGRAGVPGAYEAALQPAIVSGKRLMIDPARVAAALLSTGKAKTLTEARHLVQKMIQAAKRGR